MPAVHDAAVAASVPALWDELTRAADAGSRFAGLFATARPDGLLLTAHLAGPGGVRTLEATLPAGAGRYPALTPRLRAAFWYEREIHDLFGVIPAGHPRLEPLVLPLGRGARRPQPGTPGRAAVAEPYPRALPRHVTGPGMFTIPHGPVRSGVVESMEYLVETPGEDIPHLNMRVFYKHRGVEKRYEGMTAGDGVLLAERTEGTATSRTRWPTATQLSASRAPRCRGRPPWSGCCMRSWNGLPAISTSPSGWLTPRD